MPLHFGFKNNAGEQVGSLFVITNNLNLLAEQVGLYPYLWTPTQVAVTTASQLVQPLNDALALIDEKREALRVYEPPNKYGTVESLERIASSMLAICNEFGDASITSEVVTQGTT